MDWSRVDVTIPDRSGVATSIPGVHMAGFRYEGTDPIDIAMVAHPAVTLLFDLGDHGWAVHDRAGTRAPGDAAIGLLPGRVSFSGSAAGECLQVRLSPVLAAQVLDTSALVGNVTELDDVLGPAARRLGADLRDTTSWEERFALVLRFLGGRLDTRRTVDPEVAYVWQQIHLRHGRSGVHALAEETGWSRQRLWSRFRAQVGLSPKHAARLVRFDRAARLLAMGVPPAEAAAQAGYADQPHLNREMRSIVNRTPLDVATTPWLAVDQEAWPTLMRRAAGGPSPAEGLTAPGRARPGRAAPRVRC
ncbi:helix-turn-helix domain-containing protein [Nocardioides luteus]|uniref:helix-turn-helix domain-containing protein n=1 Tax=Nocardioides luteus TaxID=1844 RepID=UPI001A23260C|nr:helix-turn-helix domain-containing protein [Nocardioides luteus]MBG6096933.1 AraC-like DNA-binding protein [Nocardioides luteus]